jgi:hypothetical protein
MSELASKGLVEETIDRPKRYTPIDVRVALPRLAWKIRDRLDKIAKESEKLATKLQRFSVSNNQSQHFSHNYRAHANRTPRLSTLVFFLSSSTGMFLWGGARARPIVESGSEKRRRISTAMSMFFLSQ